MEQAMIVLAQLLQFAGVAMKMEISANRVETAYGGHGMKHAVTGTGHYHGVQMQIHGMNKQEQMDIR